MDTFGTIDAFVKFDHDGNQLKTKVVTMVEKEDVVWN